jgi:hypothetical protein
MKTDLLGPTLAIAFLSSVTFALFNNDNLTENRIEALNDTFARSAEEGSVWWGRSLLFLGATDVDRALARSAYGDNLGLFAYLWQEYEYTASDAAAENALVWAAQGGSYEVARFLLEHNVGMNCGEALFQAVHSNNIEMVRLLLENGGEKFAAGTPTNSWTDAEIISLLGASSTLNDGPICSYNYTLPL